MRFQALFKEIRSSEIPSERLAPTDVDVTVLLRVIDGS